MNPASLRVLRPFAIALMVMAWFGLTPGPAWAHGGLSMDKDMCRLTLGLYTMHFTGYQPVLTGAMEFCEDIPKTGQIIVTMDMIDDALRAMPVSVRIVRDTGEGSETEANTVLYLEPKLYPNGSVSFEHNFEAPGKFIGLVTGGDPANPAAQYVSRFPFSVGISRPAYEIYAGILLVLAAGYGLYLYSGRARATAT